MKIKITNLGTIKQAEFTLNDLTILCGENNTGKTYATYALYGFLSFWNEKYEFKLAKEDLATLFQNGSVRLDADEIMSNMPKVIQKACKEFEQELPNTFASLPTHFKDSAFSIELNTNDIPKVNGFSRILNTGKAQILSIEKKHDERYILISLFVNDEELEIPKELIRRVIGDTLKYAFFNNVFPKVFIASAERTGAAIFQKELNFSRNRLLEKISANKIGNIDTFELLNESYSDYALPVKDNVDFTRQLERVIKLKSFITKEYPDLLNEFADIIGGTYHINENNEITYTPTEEKLALTMGESSSAVRALLIIGFYLRHIARKGDIVIIDEPELNLHPKNQRRIARLLAQLVNIGLKVFITTHSDYIIKELNTLIMLNKKDVRLKTLAEREGYKKSELLDYKKVHVYITEKALTMCDGDSKGKEVNTLVLADIDAEHGIEVRTFDNTIADMNRIQDEIIWGGDA